MKRFSLVITLVCFAFGLTFAQGQLTGTVTDESGETLIGASVLVKGTTSGTVTDIDGKFSLAVPANSEILIVSYTGFASKEVSINGATTLIIVLEESAAQLGEVVVTGLGIKREKKALGYAVTTIAADQLEARPEADVSRVLRGKVPGVNITQTSGLAGSGTNIIIRGYSSIQGSNQPLFVVDGIPFNTNTNSDQSFDNGGSSASSRFLDLDPNTIAEVNVLKGLSATVLYGEQGRNGVILITTKNGLAGNIDKKFEVTIDQGLYISRIASLPDDQDLYGNGFHNEASLAFSNWGAPFNQPGRNALSANGTIPHPYRQYSDVLPEFEGADYDYRAYDNLQGFFQDGLIKSTAINIANRISDGTSVNFSYAFRDEESFVPLSTLQKHNFGLGFQTKLDNGLQINATFNYVNNKRVAPPTAISFSSNPAGSDLSASLFSNVFYTPRSIDLNGLPFEDPTNRQSIFYRSDNGIQNPYWTLNNTGDNEQISRFFSTIALTYPVADWLTANYRLGVDNYSQESVFHINKGGVQLPLGAQVSNNRRNLIQDHNLNLQTTNQLGENFTLDGVLGVNIRRDNFDRITTRSEQQFVYGLIDHENYIIHDNDSRTIDENLIGVYANAVLGFRRYLYLNLSARNDWTSTLEPANRSVLYPSASLAFVPTDAFSGLQNSRTLNYLKFRAGIGTSAGYPDPYSTRSILGLETRSFVGRTGNVVNSNFVDNVLGNPNLQAEIHTEIELGVEARMFDNRVRLDLSAYTKNSSDLIIPLDLDPSTGYTSTTVNAAELNNRGLEIGLEVSVIQAKNINLSLNTNFTRNVSEVLSIAEGVDQVGIAGFTNIGNFAIVGQQYGIIQGTALRRSPAGDPVLNNNGQYLDEPGLNILGDPNPNYVLNYGASLNVFGVKFNALLTYSDGGAMYATTPSTLMGRGILQETGFDRFVPVIAPGVVANADGSFSPNTTQITSTQHYWTNGGVFHDEMRVYDATYLKLREISASYSLPTAMLDGTPLGGVTFTLSAQNLWFRAYGFPKGANFDPEVSSTGVGNGQGFELMNVPTAKQFGGSVRLTF
jgi:TonB-linked SusC/RagA family outer membrane protein